MFLWSASLIIPSHYFIEEKLQNKKSLKKFVLNFAIDQDLQNDLFTYSSLCTITQFLGKNATRHKPAMGYDEAA